jgi:hypothetical protein
MSTKSQTHPDSINTKQIDAVIDAVLQRGFDDSPQVIDDYSALIQTFEVRKLVTFQLYYSYFPPKRHEFDLQILTYFVDEVVRSQTASFIARAAANAIIGGASFAVTKKLCGYIADKFRSNKRSTSTVRDIERTSDSIAKYFKTHNQATETALSTALGIEPHKLQPLLMLHGFRCRRKGKRRVWSKPLSWRT